MRKNNAVTQSVDSSKHHSSDNSQSNSASLRTFSLNRKQSKVSTSKKKKKAKASRMGSQLSYSFYQASSTKKLVNEIGYYSGCEFEHVASDLERSYCSSMEG